MVLICTCHDKNIQKNRLYVEPSSSRFFVFFQTKTTETMQNHLVITVIGSHSKELLEEFYRAIRDCGCNIVDGRITSMGNILTMNMMLSGSWDTIAKMESMLPKLGKKLELNIHCKRTDAQAPVKNLMPYAIDVVSFDHAGVVHDIVRFFNKNNIPIQDMYTSTYAAAHTGTPMLTLHMTVNIPTSVSIASLRGEFMDFCDQLNLDAIMEPVK